MIKPLSLWVNITLNCHVVGFDIGCHEAIITVSLICFFSSTTVVWYTLNLSLKSYNGFKANHMTV